MTYEIDFYKEFGLENPVCGLINRITSPKGIRRKESEFYTSYHLHADLVNIYEGMPIKVNEGLYWVMDVCKIEDKMTWIHYLFVVDSDGSTYPVYEYVGAKDSTWIKDALPIIKRFFDGEDLPVVDITVFETKKSKNRWNTVAR